MSVRRLSVWRKPTNAITRPCVIMCPMIIRVNLREHQPALLGNMYCHGHSSWLHGYSAHAETKLRYIYKRELVCVQNFICFVFLLACFHRSRLGFQATRYSPCLKFRNHSSSDQVSRRALSQAFCSIIRAPRLRRLRVTGQLSHWSFAALTMRTFQGTPQNAARRDMVASF